MVYVVSIAWLKQRSVIVPLLDLRNAFGEVHYNLMKNVLEYHHIPESLELLITNLCTDIHSYVISDSFSTPAIPFKLGLFQGNCLSSVTFNLCFAISIEFIRQEEYI